MPSLGYQLQPRRVRFGRLRDVDDGSVMSLFERTLASMYDCAERDYAAIRETILVQVAEGDLFVTLEPATRDFAAASSLAAPGTQPCLRHRRRRRRSSPCVSRSNTGYRPQRR